jgi:hypothetical protein
MLVAPRAMPRSRALRLVWRLSRATPSFCYEFSLSLHTRYLNLVVFFFTCCRLRCITIIIQCTVYLRYYAAWPCEHSKLSSSEPDLGKANWWDHSLPCCPLWVLVAKKTDYCLYRASRITSRKCLKLLIKSPMRTLDLEWLAVIPSF